MSLLLALTGGAPGSIDLSSATTDGADVLASNVSIVVATSSATTDGADVLASSISVIVAASSAKTDGADVLAGNVSALVGASSATTDGADVLAGSVSPIVAGSSATTDGADVLAANVTVVASSVDVSSATTDGADVLAANVSVSSVSIDISASITDGPDVMAGRIQKIEGGHFGGEPKKHKSEIKKRDEKLKRDIQKQFEQIIEGKIDNPQEIEQLKGEIYSTDHLDKVLIAELLAKLDSLELQLLELDEDDEESLLMLM